MEADESSVQACLLRARGVLRGLGVRRMTAAIGVCMTGGCTSVREARFVTLTAGRVSRETAPFVRVS